MLCNDKSADAIKSCLNKKIAGVDVSDSSLNITFEGGQILSVWDGGQSCCESRYMTCDDDVSSFVGDKLVDMEMMVADNVEENGYGCHEIQFLNVKTNKGVFQVATHNEHNGYYGGFAIRAQLGS